MPSSSSTPARRSKSFLLPALLAFAALAGCREGDKGVTISGDVPDLDMAALRGDSLVAEATRPLFMDSTLVADYNDSTALAPVSGDTSGAAATRADAARARVARAVDSVPAVVRPGDNPMSRRAQARGDSMARASALTYSSRARGGTRGGGDSARGVVTLLGTAPARQAVLKDANGAIITLSGMATGGLSRLEGVEIVVRGVRITTREVVVSDYIVRGVRGAPAWDGRLEETADGWSLQLTDGSGRKHLASPPAALRALAGSRVWVSIRSGNTPAEYGIVGRR